MRSAIYARYSTDNQRDTSIEDQIRICREQLQREGIRIHSEQIYEDRAETGATMHLRDGIKTMLRDAEQGRIDVVIAESLSRFSRDQEDTAYIYKRLNFHQVRMMTALRGVVTDMDIGFESTINARYLKDCADQVRRGLRGHVERGKNPGGLSYGYNIVRKIGEDGEIERGLLEINEEHAAIIRRVFEEYGSGMSPRAIVKRLNEEGVPAPRGSLWRTSTVHGDGKRGNGILRNQKYIGYLLWNRSHAVRSPYTGRRIFRINPRDEWIVVEKPEWRIISDELWDKAQARLKKYARPQGATQKSRRTTRLLSGLLECGCCGRPMTIQHSGINGRGERHSSLYGCTGYNETMVCENNRKLSQQKLEERVLEGIKENLMSPEAWAAFIEGYTERKKQEQRDKRIELKSAAKELAEIEKKVDAMLDALTEGLLRKSMYPRLNALGERRDELEELLARPLDEEEIALHPSLGKLFTKKIATLQHYLVDGDELIRNEAREVVRDMIAKVTLKPIEDANWEITIHGSVGEIMKHTGMPADDDNRALPVGRIRQSEGDSMAGRRSDISVAPTLVAEDRFERGSDMGEIVATILLHEPVTEAHP